MSTETTILPLEATKPLCGSMETFGCGSIKDLWGVVVPSDFILRGGGETIVKHAVRLPCQQNYRY